MAELIVAAFQDEANAQRAEESLLSHGIPASAIRRYRADDANAPKLTETETVSTEHRPAHHGGGFFSWLFGDEGESSDYSHDDRRIYDEHIFAGRPIISVHVEQADHEAEVIRLLEGFAISDVETQHDPLSTATTGMTHPTTLTDTTTATTTDTVGLTDRGGLGRTDTADLGQPHSSYVAPEAESVRMRDTTAPGTEEVISLSEEQLEVGKRTVDRGTTQIRKFVTQRPVSQTIPLRDETTTIEHRKPIGTPDGQVGAFEERTVEVRNTTEEPVISKTAKVVDEVVIHKQVTEREETVQDTVRREEIETWG